MGTIRITDPKIGSIRLQSATYGVTVPVVFGKTRVTGNVLWFGDFKATSHTKKQESGGFFGIGETEIKTTTYTYSASLIMGLCEGPIVGVPRIWRAKGKYPNDTVSIVDRIAALFGKKGDPVTIDAIDGTDVVMASETYAVPGGGGAKTVTNAATWSYTKAVYYTGPLDVGDAASSQTGPIYLAEGVDYTVAAGVYTFGPAFAGKTVTIDYQYGDVFPQVQSSLTQTKLGLAYGAVGQATWAHLTSHHPTEAIPYSGLAYVYAQDYALASDASLENHTFEVQARLCYSLGSGAGALPDADPALITLAMLTDGRYGALFSAQRLNFKLWSDYCLANSLLMSPAFTEQLAAAELVEKMTWLTNSAPVWSAGKLKIVPYGDQAISGALATYSPRVTPIYDLDDRHFLPRSGGGEPVAVTPKASRDAKNHIRIEFLDRAQDYNVSIAEAKDQADIDLNGLRSADIVKAHWICDRDVAAKVAQLRLQRSLYVRTEYSFQLPWTFALLEAMDLVTITDSYLGFDKLPVRIIEVGESEDGELDITAEEFPAGVATTSLYGMQAADGAVPDFNFAPSSVQTPYIFEAPGNLSVTGLEVYAAVTGTDIDWGGCTVWTSLDGTTYYESGRIFGGSRYGTLTGPIAAGNLPVHLVDDRDTIAAVSAAEATALSSLCYIGGATPEYLAHTGAAAGGTAGDFTLSGLVRGAYGTSAASAHATSDPFVRIDQAVGKTGPLELSYIGKTIYFKFTSFNLAGQGEQALADVTAYPYTITGAMAALGSSRPKLVTLTASAQAFTYSGAGAADPGGQSITFTARRQNTVASDVTWTTTPAVTLGGTGTDVRTLSIANFGANTAVTVRATADGVYDEITVVRLQDGLDGTGTSPVSGILSNEAHTVPADNAGAVTSYAGSGTELRVYEGVTLLDYDGVGTANGKWTVTKAATSITAGATSATGTTPNRYATIGDHSTMTADAAYIDYTVSGKTAAGTAFGFTKRQALSKSKAGATGATGSTGPAGLTTALVYIFKRSASAPALPTATVTYTFASGAITGLDNGWTAAVPAGTNPLYVSVATASSSGASDTIAAGEWATPVVLAQNGTDGTNGTNGTNGLNVATAFLYQRTATNVAPSVTTTGSATYTFSTGAITGQPAGWLAAVPASGGAYLWVIQATASNTTATDSIANTEWSAPALLTQDGANGTNGTNGLNGTRTAILDVYRWSASAPVTFPSGTSTYTWATGQFTAPATLNGWSLTPPAPVAGQTLYIARQTYADSATSATSSVTWSTAAALTVGAAGTDGSNGANGANGQRLGVLEMYQWSASAPTTYPAGTSTYTWATGAFTAPATANGWSLTPGAAVAGQTLWGVSVAVSDNLTTATSTATWNSTTVYAVGYAGSNGAAGYNAATLTAYKRSASGAPADNPGAVTYTFAGASWTPGNSWSATIPAGTGPIYAVAATAYSNTATDSIAAGEWSAPVLIAQNGTDGATGAAGAAGLNAATVYLFQRTASATPPSLPSANVTYTFATGAASGVNNGWTQTLPTTGGAYRWVTTASALSSSATDTIAAGEWAAVALLAQDGSNGSNGTNGSNGADALTPAATLLLYAVDCDAGGAPRSGAFDNAVGQFSVFSGSTDVTASCTFSKVTSNCTGTINTATNTPVTGAKGSYRITAIASDTGYMDLTATYGGVSVTVRFSVAKVRAGTAATSITDSSIGCTNNATYTVVGGPMTLPVGPNGTITYSMNLGYAWVSGSIASNNVKFQRRATPGSGGWTDIGSVLTGFDSFSGEPGSVSGSTTEAGPASGANWEFQIVAIKVGSATLTNSGNGARFTVSWA